MESVVGGGGGGGQGGCEPRIEIFVKMQKKKWGEGVLVVGCQGECEPRIEVIVSLQKMTGGGQVGGSGRGIGVRSGRGEGTGWM